MLYFCNIVEWGWRPAISKSDVTLQKAPHTDWRWTCLQMHREEFETNEDEEPIAEVGTALFAFVSLFIGCCLLSLSRVFALV